MTAIQPQLWVDPAPAALAFYQSAFGAEIEHHVGDGEDIVAQLRIGDARFWIATASPDDGRLVPEQIGGATGRLLIVVADPDQMHAQAVAAGASQLRAVGDEHGWRVGSIRDPFGHEWEIGRPLSDAA